MLLFYETRMLNVLTCILHEHDLRLVALSAFICVLGCTTTALLLTRASASTRVRRRRWTAFAAVVL